jgi:hypothetical protein
MEEDAVLALPRPGSSLTDDPLLAVLREGARRMLVQAIEAEVDAFLAAHAGLTDAQGRRRLVRNGHAPERRIQAGVGRLEVRRRKVRDRGAADADPIRSTSATLPMIGGADHSAPDQEHRGTAALAVSEGRVNGSVRGSPGGAARAGSTWPVGRDHSAAERELAGRARALVPA